MKKVIIIRGPLGIGKSTVSKALAQKLNGLYISIDEILSEHELDKGDGIPLCNFLKVNELIASEIEKSKRSVVIDGNFYYREAIDDLVNKYDAIVFSLNASLELCTLRDSLREKPHGKWAALAVHKMVLAVEYGIVVNVEELSIEETVKYVLARV